MSSTTLAFVTCFVACNVHGRIYAYTIVNVTATVIVIEVAPVPYCWYHCHSQYNCECSLPLLSCSLAPLCPPPPPQCCSAESEAIAALYVTLIACLCVCVHPHHCSETPLLRGVNAMWWQVTQLVVAGVWSDSQSKEAMELCLGGCAQIDSVARQCLQQAAGAAASASQSAG